MKTGTGLLAIVIGTGLLVTGAAAQHEDHHGTPPATAGDNAGAGKGGMSGGMMSGGMMSGQAETRKLVDQLAASLAAIETEKDPAALKTKLAEHGALLKQLQAKVQAQSQMMDMMQHMMDGKMMGGKMMDEKTMDCKMMEGGHKN
jgi:hypothetical protein